MPVVTQTFDCTDAIIASMLEILGKESTSVDEAVQDLGLVGRANAARHRAELDWANGADQLRKQPDHPLAKAWRWATDIGADYSVPAWVLEPSAVLPESFLKPAHTVMQAWTEKYGALDIVAQKRGYLADVVPTLKSLEKRIDDLPEHLQRYAWDYVTDYMDGGEFFELKPVPRKTDLFNPVVAASKNVVKNIVAGNPLIAALNTIEWIPKTLAEHGPINTLRALGQVVGNTKGNLWGRIPELDQLGVYGHGEGPQMDPLGWTETFNKGIYYYAGAAGKNSEAGLLSVQQLGFQYRPGDAPTAFRSRSRNDIALMRYAIGQTLLLGRWAHNLSGKIVDYRAGKLALHTPDAQAMAAGAAALSTWAIAQSVMTGFKSTGIVLYDLLPEDYRQALDALEETLPVNLVKKTTGIDLADKTKPGGVAFGVGLHAATSAVQSAAKGVSQVREGLETEDSGEVTRGLIRFFANSLMLGPTTKLRLNGNVVADIGAANYRKLGSVVEKIVTREIDPSTYEDVTDAVIEQYAGKQGG